MKNIVIRLSALLTLLCACFVWAQTGQPAAQEELNLKTIIDSPETYKGAPVAMVLRLKGYNPRKNIIAFYDEDNRDIDFDIMNWHKDKQLRIYMRSLVNGLRYKVRFQVQDVQDGVITADLESFVPVFLDKL